MAKLKGLMKIDGGGYAYRRRVPEALRAAFNCGEFCKVSLGTGDLREAERAWAIANGEYEQKLGTFRRRAASGADTDEAAKRRSAHHRFDAAYDHGPKFICPGMPERGRDTPMSLDLFGRGEGR